MMRRAEDALSALDAAGWQLTAYPRMEIGGDILPFTQTLGGELVEPSTQGSIEMKMRFGVNRPR